MFLINTYLPTMVYSIGGCHELIYSSNFRPTLTYFQFSCAFLLCVILVFSFNGKYNFMHIPLWLEWSLILYYLWSAFYGVMFSARMLKSVTEGELVNRSDSFITFLYRIYAMGFM